VKLRIVLGLGAALLVGAASAFAQGPLYKLKQPDGRVTYSSEKLPGMQVEKELPSSVPASALRGRPFAISTDERAAEKRIGDQIASRDQLWRERNQARDGLAATRAAKAVGEEPLPGERTGTASGRARLNDAYWARQDELRKAVERAEQRLERAERALRGGL
ncbi:MAG: DUF4124 domain-containing protein, partial [Betaproteobacteria bacterium]|nr:DUF4124 domain-containing protein [Betaproteobacteria bacterium]